VHDAVQLGVTVGHHHDRRARDEHRGDRESEPGRSPGDQRDLVPDVEQGGEDLPGWRLCHADRLFLVRETVNICVGRIGSRSDHYRADTTGGRGG
jgi:hypothetical protein